MSIPKPHPYLRPVPSIRIDEGQKPLADARMEALRARDQVVLGQVLRELLPRVRAWTFRLLGPRADLDDAVQDALTEIAGSLHRYEGRASLATLAHKITVRVAYRYFGKRAQREMSLELVAPPPEEIDPESRAMSREALKRLYRCLDRLPEKRRVAFVLCCVEGLTPTEAAELEGVKSDVMRSRLMNARAEIARRLSADPYMSAMRRGEEEEDA